MSLLALFVTLALIACASTSKFCCGPESYSSQTLVHMYRNGVFYEGKGALFFDKGIGMTSSYTYYGKDETKNKFLVSTYLNMKSSDMYVVYGENCTKLKSDMTWLKNPEKANCIPDNAKLTKSFVVGGRHEDVEMNQFNIKMKNGQAEMLFTKNHCFPVQEIVISNKNKKGGSDLFYKMNMVNLIPTVSDPTVFVVPRICTKTPFSTEENVDRNLPFDPRHFVPSLGRFY